MRIAKYHCVTSRSPDGLSKRVNELIAAGWQPIGGPSYSSKHSRYVQAMGKSALESWHSRAVSEWQKRMAKDFGPLNWDEQESL